MMRPAEPIIDEGLEVALHTVGPGCGGAIVRVVAEGLGHSEVSCSRLLALRRPREPLASHYCDLSHCGVIAAESAADSVFSARSKRAGPHLP
jgi:hypothetical protein